MVTLRFCTPVCICKCLFIDDYIESLHMTLRTRGLFGVNISLVPGNSLHILSIHPTIVN